jgi:hypothetical protein
MSEGASWSLLVPILAAFIRTEGMPLLNTSLEVLLHLLASSEDCRAAVLPPSEEQPEPLVREPGLLPNLLTLLPSLTQKTKRQLIPSHILGKALSVVLAIIENASTAQLESRFNLAPLLGEQMEVQRL